MIGFKNIQYHYNLCEKDTNYLASHILRLSLQERWEVCRRCKRQFQKRIGDGLSLDAVEATTSAAVLRLSDEKRSRIGGRWSGGWARKGAKPDLHHVGVLAELIITNCTF